MQGDGFFPRRIECAIFFAERHKALVIAVVGYALCRCASSLPHQLLFLSDASHINNVGKVVGMLAFLLLAFTVDRHRKSFWILILPGLISVVGCFMLLGAAAAEPLDGGLHLALSGAGTFVLGVGTAAATLQWLEYIGCASLKEIAIAIGGGESLGSALMVIVGANGLISLAYLPLVTTASLTLLVWFRRICDVDPAPSPSLSLARRSLANLRRLVSLRLVVWAGAYCFSYGLVNSLIGASMFSVSDNLGNILPGATVVLASAFLPDRFDIRALKGIAFTFMVAGILLLGFFDVGNVFTQLLASAGAASCRLFAYSLACMKARSNQSSALPACFLVKCLVILTMSLGAFVGGLDLPTDRTFLIVGVVFAVCILSVCLSPFSVDESRILERATQFSGVPGKAELLQEIAGEKALSDRERTIFALMVDGQDIAGISNMLFISRSTVRAHASRIYAKFDVHSRQELDDLVNRIIPESDSGAETGGQASPRSQRPHYGG